MTVTNRRLHFMQLLPMTWHKIVRMDAPVMVNACWVIANAIQALAAMTAAKVSGFSIFSYRNRSTQKDIGMAWLVLARPFVVFLFYSATEMSTAEERKIATKRFDECPESRPKRADDFMSFSCTIAVVRYSTLSMCVWHPTSINRKCSMNRE